MNTQFNPIDYIDTLPGNIRRNVLFSIVGSLNASLIGSASSIARRLKSEDIDIIELSPYELETYMRAPDYQNGLDNLRNVNALAQHWRDDLVALTDQDNAGALSETIDFMIKSPRKLDDDLLKATLATAGLDIPTDLIKAKHDIQQLERSKQLAAQRGEIEWIIDQCLNDDIEPNFFSLTEDQQSNLTSKLLTALNRTRDNAILGVLNRDRRWSFGDLPILQNAIKHVEQHG